MPAYDRDVSQTDLSVKGRSLQGGFIDGMGGLKSNVSSLLRAPNEFEVLDNFQMLKQGIWSSPTGIGWQRHKSTAINSGARMWALNYYMENTGVRTPLIFSGNNVYTYNIGTTTETLLYTVGGGGIVAPPTMRRFRVPASNEASLIICMAGQQPVKMTGAASVATLQANAANWPQTIFGRAYSAPELCEIFNYRVVFARFVAGTAVFNDVLISNLASPETFTLGAPPASTDGSLFLIPADFGRITSLRSHRLSNLLLDEILIIGCERGMWMLTGNGPANYSLKPLTSEVGMYGNHTWVQVGNDLMFLSTGGIRTLSGILNNQILQMDTVSRGINDLIQQIDTTAAANAFSYHNPQTQEIQWWVPLTGDSGNNAHAFILNYNNPESAGGAISARWSTKSGTSVACAGNFGTAQMYGGGYNGLLQQHYTGNTYDGSTIQFNLRTAVISLGNPSQKQSVRNVSVVADGGDQGFNITVYFFTKMINSQFFKRVGSPSNFRLESANPPTTILGSWVLGISAFPSQANLKVGDFQPIGNGQFVQVEIVSTKATDALDYSGIEYTLSGGSIQR